MKHEIQLFALWFCSKLLFKFEWTVRKVRCSKLDEKKVQSKCRRDYPNSHPVRFVQCERIVCRLRADAKAQVTENVK